MRFSGHILPGSKRGAAGGEAGCLHHDRQLSCLTPYFLRLLIFTPLFFDGLTEWRPLLNRESSMLIFSIRDESVCIHSANT